MKNTPITNLSDVLGWLGTIAYIVAYLLLSIGKLKAEQKTYHLLNILYKVNTAVMMILIKKCG